MENNEVISTQKEEINMEWVIYVLVWFFLWSFWVHRFMAWKIWSWIWMLALTVWWFILAIVLIWFLLLWAVWIWWLIDWILLLSWKFEDSKHNLIKMKKTIS